LGYRKQGRRWRKEERVRPRQEEHEEFESQGRQERWRRIRTSLESLTLCLCSQRRCYAPQEVSSWGAQERGREHQKESDEVNAEELEQEPQREGRSALGCTEEWDNTPGRFTAEAAQRNAPQCFREIKR
jgi:hypothetical protein